MLFFLPTGAPIPAPGRNQKPSTASRPAVTCCRTGATSFWGCSKSCNFRGNTSLNLSIGRSREYPAEQPLAPKTEAADPDALTASCNPTIQRPLLLDTPRRRADFVPVGDALPHRSPHPHVIGEWGKHSVTDFRIDQHTFPIYPDRTDTTAQQCTQGQGNADRLSSVDVLACNIRQYSAMVQQC